jgi:hypothetical protein
VIVTWLIANTAGSTKKAVVTVMYNIGSSAGNIIGPFLFQAKEQPYYRYVHIDATDFLRTGR